MEVTIKDIIGDSAAQEYARQIYLEAFPPAERRAWDQIVAPARAECPRLQAVMVDGRMTGMVTTWRMGGFVYVEHFAIDPANRGGGIGAAALRAVAAASHPLPLVLEVEPESADDPMTGRRIAFYRRNGLEVVDRTYVQPPYGAGLPEVPLWLMSTDPGVDTAEATARLHSRVYGKQ